MDTSQKHTPVELLSHKARELTPLPFARLLVARVRQMFCVEHVAVLWVHRKSTYWQLWPEVELWGAGRDANKYDGPWPIIAHPPCGPWGNYKAVCKQSKHHGINAMKLVHRWGGIVEQPVGSSLFREHGLPAGTIEKVNQGVHGHPSIKATNLYIWRTPSHE